MRSHSMFVDESKAKTFVLAGALCPDNAHHDLRMALKVHLMPGQQRLHFSRESDSRRASILECMLQYPIRAAVVDVPKTPSEIEARILALGTMLKVAQTLGVTRLCIEEDTSNVIHDRTVIHNWLRKEPGVNKFSYSWLRASQEPLLWIPDAIAWAWFRGGRWRRFIDPLIAWRES